MKPLDYIEYKIQNGIWLQQQITAAKIPYSERYILDIYKNYLKMYESLFDPKIYEGINDLAYNNYQYSDVEIEKRVQELYLQSIIIQ